MKIHSVVESKFWIVTDLGSKVGTVRLINSGYEFFDQRTGKKEILKNIEHLDQVSKDFDISDNKLLDGYYTGVKNPIAHDVGDTLPTFRKTPGAKTIYCAGYYIVKFSGMGWQYISVPKYTTLTKYKYKGPFLTEWEMNLELRKHRRSSSDEKVPDPHNDH